jgi:tetratricopeptide (TPR) repeat protein
MKDSSRPLFNLNDLVKSQTFDSLAAISDPVTWQPLKSTDRELLAELLITKGQKLLGQGDAEALLYFEKAKEVASHSPKVFFLLGNAYASQDTNMGFLRSALESYNQSINLSADKIDIQVWKALINLLLQKGDLLGEVGYFQAAKEKCQLLFSYAPALAPDVFAQFLWLYGRCYFLAGKIYGEVIDFHEALDRYRLAAEKGLNTPEFWKDYGDVLFELADLLERSDLYGEAAEYYQKSIKLSHDCIDSWHSIALCYLHLFEDKGSLLDYDFAKSSFENTAKLDNTNYKIWLNWGSLECEYGKQNGDAKSLQESIIKFSKASELEPNHPLIYRNWGEALMFLGSLTEEVQLLKAAERQLIHSLEMHPESCETWHLYGICLNELGRYFSDERYYHHAIEKFQHGISINNQFPALWHGMGLSMFSIGEMNSDQETVEKASTHFSKAIDLGASKSPQCWNDWGVAMMRLAELSNDKTHIESAVEKFQKALGLQETSSPQPADPELLYNYGCAMDFLGDYYDDAQYYEKAIEALSNVLAIDPEYIHARYNLALAFSHLGELVMDVECFQRAAEQFQFLLNLDNEDEMAWHEFGMTLLNLAHLIDDPALPTKSQSYFEQAEIKLMHAQSLGCSQSYYALACLYSLTNNIGAGIYYLEKADLNNVLPSIEELLQDEWLENLRRTSAFQNFQANKEREL